MLHLPNTSVRYLKKVGLREALKISDLQLKLQGSSHYKKLHGVVKEAQDFYHIHKGLGDKLGPVLFQLHPRFDYSEEHLERVLRVVDPSFTNVIEFRHASWWHEHVFNVLEQRSIISYPSLPDDVIKTTPVMYYRFYGVPQLYKSS
jgi:uncharacterized protein YecE (DUF72 family)